MSAPPKLDRYEITGLLGQGAYGVVYLAMDPKLDREVAIKVINPELAADSDALMRFHREAKATARLRHPNIVEVFDYAGADAPFAYLVIERLRGQTLQKLVSDRMAERGRALDAVTAAAIGHEIALALEHAHAAGIVHRDLKPENVFIEPDGRIVLTDFGIARAFRADDGSSGGPNTQLLGSPLYMSPEQISKPELLGPGSDFFSLGSTIYFLVTGTTPFKDETVLGVLKRIVAGVFEPLQKVRPEIPKSLSSTVDALLRPDLSQRLVDPEVICERLFTVMQEAGEADPRRTLKKRLSQLADENTNVTAVVPLDAAEQTRIITLTHSVTQTNIKRSGPALESVGEHDGATRTHIVTETHATTQKSAKVRRGLGLGIWIGLGVCGAIVLAAVTTLGWQTNERVTVRVQGGQTPSPTPAPVTVQPLAPPENIALPPTPPPSLPPPSSLTPTVAVPVNKPTPLVDKPGAKSKTQKPTHVATGGPGSLKIVALPWAYVYVDEHQVGTTPAFRTLPLSAGRHHVKVSNPNFAAIERDFEIRAGDETKLSFDLEHP